MEYMVGIVALLSIFVGFPWVIFHYITRWKTAATLTTADENLLDELHDLARRLEERMVTIERIVQAENPNWRSLAADPIDAALEDRAGRDLETSLRSNRASRRNA